MEKTFAQKVKTELCEPRVERKCCAVAEAYGVLLYAHSFSPRSVRIRTASDEFAERLPHLFRRAFGQRRNVHAVLIGAGGIVHELL